MSIHKDKRELTQEQLEKVAGGQHAKHEGSTISRSSSNTSPGSKPPSPVRHFRSSTTSSSTHGY
jgi:hypothetical protein